MPSPANVSSHCSTPIAATGAQRRGDVRGGGGRGKPGACALAPTCTDTLHAVYPLTLLHLPWVFSFSAQGNSKCRLSEKQVSRQPAGFWLPCDLVLNRGWIPGSQNLSHIGAKRDLEGEGRREFSRPQDRQRLWLCF